MRLADDAQVGSPSQEAVNPAGATGIPTDEAVATAGPADAPTETPVSTAVAADTLHSALCTSAVSAATAASEGTPEPAQASSSQTEANNEAETIPVTAETTTADNAQHKDGVSVPDALAVDAHQTGIAAVDTAAAPATADKPVAAANNAAAAAAVAEAVVADAVADAVAVTAAAAKAAASPADGATDAAAASVGHKAASEEGAAREEGAASNDLAHAAVEPKSESDHMDGVASSVKQDQNAADSHLLSSRQAFAAAQYATGMAAMTLMTHVFMCLWFLCCNPYGDVLLPSYNYKFFSSSGSV